MPTFAQRITSCDGHVAAHASESGTLYGTRLSVRVGHRSERVSHRSEGVVHRSPFVGMHAESFEHPETDADMRPEPRALRSLFLEHANVFVAMRDAIGTMQYERTSDAPRRASALPRTRRASHRAAKATVHVPRDTLPSVDHAAAEPRTCRRVPCDVPPTPRDSPPIPGDAARVRRDVPPTSRDASPAPPDVQATSREAPAVPRHTPPSRRDSLPTPRGASRVPRASLPVANDALPGVDHAAAEPRTCRRTPRDVTPSRGHPGGTPRGASRARSDAVRFCAE
jgi:hypothetical protein